MKLILTFILLAQPQDQPVDPDALRADQFDRELGFGIEPRVGIWWPDLNGRIVADEGTFFGPMIDGSSIRLDSTLHIDDHDPFGYYELGFVEVEARAGRRTTFDRLTLSFWMHEWDGDTTLDAQEVFNGATFNAGESVDSKFRVWSFGLDGAPVSQSFNDETMVAAFTIGMRVIEVKASMSAPGRDTAERTRLIYLGGGMRNEWKPSEYVFGAISGGVYFSVGTVDEDWEWMFEDWWGIAADGAASVGVDVSHVRAEIGLRFAANIFDIAREDELAREDNRFSYFLFGPFAQLSLRW